jgi:hypothetical protein
MAFSTDNGVSYPTTITGFQLPDIRFATLTSSHVLRLALALGILRRRR